MSLVAIALLLACTPTAILDFAIPKWKEDNKVRIEDAYKWIYQATRGGEHAAPDREMAGQRLESEWLSLDKAAMNEPLWERLCKEDSIGRLNLRVYKQRGGKVGDALEAFLTSSREYEETGTNFIDTWLQLGERLRRQPVNALTFVEWTRLDSDVKAKSYPAIHHSKTYEEARHPAYRLVTGVQYQKLRVRLK